VRGVFFTPGWQAILGATGAGTLAGVIVTQIFNVWTRHIDANTRAADRQQEKEIRDADRQHERDIRDADHQHERATAYQQRVWQAKHDALTRLISACRFVKWQAQLTGAENTDEKLRRAATTRALDLFRDRIGGEDGISEITAYGAEPVRNALDEVLEQVNEQRRKHINELLKLRNIGTQWDAVSKEPLTDPSGNPTLRANQLMQQRSYLYSQREQTLDDIGGNSDLDVDGVIDLCDRVIDVARKDLEGRYTE
jgi:hypothetical protein